MALALSVGLGAGCNSPTPTAAGRSQSTSSSASTRAKPKARTANPARVASAHAHYAAGIIAEMNGDAATACDEFQRAVTEDPDDEALLLDVTRRLLQNKRAEKALEFLLATTARGNVSGEIYARLGHVHFQLGHVEEAIRANRLAIQKAPQLLTGYQNLFLNLLVSKQNEEAIKLLDTAAAQEKAAPEFLLGLADLYQNYAQQFPTQREAIQKKSLATLRAAAAQKPADPQLRLRLADGFYTLGETQRAAEIYLPLLPQLEDLPLLLENVRAKLAAFLKEQGVGADRIQPAPFSSTQKQAIFSDKVKSHKVSTLVKITTHNEQEFQSVTKAVDQFNEVTYVRAEFEHSDKDALKAKASAKACEEAERQKRVYEEKLNVKLVPKNIADARQTPILMAGQQYVGASGGTQPAYSGLPMLSPALRALAQKEEPMEETPFGELVFSARLVVEYSVERK